VFYSLGDFRLPNVSKKSLDFDYLIERQKRLIKTNKTNRIVEAKIILLWNLVSFLFSELLRLSNLLFDDVLINQRVKNLPISITDHSGRRCLLVTPQMAENNEQTIDGVLFRLKNLLSSKREISLPAKTK